MYKKALILMTILVFGSVGLAFGQATLNIVYDGMVKNIATNFSVTEDTGIFVTNQDTTNDLTLASITVYQQDGTPVGPAVPLIPAIIPPNGFGWITLGEVLRANSLLTDGREKFTFRIAVTETDAANPDPIVEVKQVTYEKITPPSRMINNDGGTYPSFRTCSETDLTTWVDVTPAG